MMPHFEKCSLTSATVMSVGKPVTYTFECFLQLYVK